MDANHVYGRYVALLSSMFVSLVAGTPYLYGVYSPQLVQRVGLSTTDAATISVAVNIGSGLGGLPAGLFIDRYGPQYSILLGSVCIFSGYLALNKVYVHQISSLFFICVLMAVMGFGSVTSFFAGLKAAQANFPLHRGSAGALPVGAYGLAATIFSFIAAKFFDGKTEQLLFFLAVFNGLVAFIGSWFIHIYPVFQATSMEAGNSTGSSGTLSGPRNPLRGSFSFWGIGKRTPRSSVYLLSSDLAPLVDSMKSQPKVLEHRESMASLQNSGLVFSTDDPLLTTMPSNEDMGSGGTSPAEVVVPIAKPHAPEGALPAIKWLLTNKTYLTYYTITALNCGVSQMYIYCVGFVVTAQFRYNNVNSGSPAALQAVQVSTISIASFAGRVTSGLVSDYIYKRMKAQRLWVVLFTVLLCFIGQVLIALTNDLGTLTLTSLIIGGSYGLFNGTFPAIMADTFGTSVFSTAWGLNCSGPLLLLFGLEKYFGQIYDGQSEEIGVCTKGNECYRGAFQLSSVICVLTFSITAVMIYIKRGGSNTPRL